MSAWTLAQATDGQSGGWSLPGLNFAQAAWMSTPLATDELLKMFEERAKDAAASASATRRASSAVADRYAQVIDRLKSANDALAAEVTTIHEQLMAEVSAAMNSPLVDRCKRAYQAMLGTYAHEVAAASSRTMETRTEFATATRRAADVYGRAIADLSADLARQLSAAYERYLSSLVSAAMDADLSGLVAAGNEELLEAMVQAFQPPTDAQPEGEERAGSTDALGGAGDTESGGWTSGTAETGDSGAGGWGPGASDPDEALWAAARAGTWDADQDDDGWGTATTPSFGDTGAGQGNADFGVSAWGPAGTGPDDLRLPEDDVGLAPWGSSGAFRAEDVADGSGGVSAATAGATSEAEDSAGRRGPWADEGEADPDGPSSQPAAKTTAKKSAAKKATARRSAAEKASAGESVSQSDESGE